MVRHGLMLVGETYSSKSECIKCLAVALSELEGKNLGSTRFEKVKPIYVNPKSVIATQLFGLLDKNTNSYTSGIISEVFYKCIDEAKNPEKKWIVFDGPVDALWIENMNTVLDDNKKLCLPSNDILNLTDQMTMMFEVEDLS
jgi:dynein heavy chain